jgi:hypothetical protein
MIAQSSLTVVARVSPGAAPGLEALLATMNIAPGAADPANPIVPFSSFEGLHFARFVLLDDATVGDVRLYNLPPPDLPLYLAFLCDFDGDVPAFLEELAGKAAPGLARIFAFCEDFDGAMDLREWMRAHSVPAAANYVNWVGRTVGQTRQEAALRQAVRRYIGANQAVFKDRAPEQKRLLIQAHIRKEVAEARLKLTPISTKELTAELLDLLDLLAGGLLILLALPLLAVLVLLRIRPAEKTDPVYAPRPTEEHVRALADQEDYDVTNQFSVIGSVKPGPARSLTVRFVLWVIDWAGRHLYTKGRLARVRTIHFARWVCLDGGRRILFASNYDGSLESYMDDFIDKVSFGLNVSFSNGIAYPTTRWLLLEGAKDEQTFKKVLRRHQIPTQVWYNANPGMTAIELERNGRVRAGLEAAALPDNEAREWLQLL